MANGITWTAEQTELARKMLRRRAPEHEFRETFGKSKAAAKDRIYRENFKLARARKPPVRVESSPLNIPPDVIADLESRKKSQRLMTPAAILMGDPEPGRRRF
jgi:hypothetical protein